MISIWQEKIAVNNDAAAFERLYLHVAPELTRFACSFVKEPAIAEDIVAETFATLWKKRATLMEIENLRVYLFSSIRNASLNHLQQQQRTAFYSFDQLSVALGSYFSTANPEQQYITRELAAAVAQAVESLPPKCRMIFKLAREERLRYKEIAAILNISVRTIDSQVAIALRRIHTAIAPYLVKYP